MFRYLFFLFILLSLFSCGGDSQRFITDDRSSVSSVASVQKDGSPETSSGSKRGMTARYIPGEVLVKFKTGTSASRMHVLHNALGATKIKEIAHIGVHRIKLPHEISVEKAVKYYKADPDVEYAEPNYIIKKATIPNDPDFSMLWGLNNTEQTGGTFDADIDAPEAWDITTGSNSVIIAVIDTGVAYYHPDLTENIWINTKELNGTPGVDDDENGYVDDIYGWDFIDNDGYPEDYDGHGTHVSGTIAAKGNNNIGIAGVMWSAKIMPIRFLGVSGWGETAKAAEAIRYAADNGARIINASWGGGGDSQTLYDAIDYARSKDVLFVAAAGNEGNDNDSDPFYPASYNLPNIISVAATDNNDEIAYFSNYGATLVDLAAPGVDIYSSVPILTYGDPVRVYPIDYPVEDFDSASGPLPSPPSTLLGWSRGGTSPTWAITTGTGIGGTNSLEDSPAENYLSNTNSWAGYMTPFTSFKNNRYTLSFKWRGILEESFDYLNINYSPDGVFWDWIDYRTGSAGMNFISDYTYEITAAADFYNSFYFGFGLESDSTVNDDGVYIDDVVLTREPISIYEYNYESFEGTSMVAPHVSGVAGLILSVNPSLTYSEVKDIILNNVDLKTSLSGKTLTGGRLNAFAAVSSIILPAPSNLAATAMSSSQINLSWTDNSSNETGFKIERKVGAAGIYSQIAIVEANVTTYPDIELTANTTYYYRVRAYNESGDSSYSNEAYATTLPLPPSAPSGLTATAVSSSQINLSWTDNSDNETEFKIERKIDAGGTYTEIATVGANIITYSDTAGLSASTTYYYRVSAYNSGGNSPYSNEASVTTPEEGKGGGGGACSIGMVHNYQTAVADTIVLLIPLVVVWILKRFRKH